MNEWSIGRLVAWREISEALRRKAIWITAALFLLLSSAAMVTPEILGSDESGERVVWSYGEVPPTVVDLLTPAADAVGISVEIEAVAQGLDLSAAIDAVEQGDVDAVVRFDTDPATIVVADEDDQLLVAALRESIRVAGTIDDLRAAGLSSDEVDALLGRPVAEVQVLDTERGGRVLVASVAALVTYLALLLLAVQISNGVAIEKSSRVSEVLLAVAPPRALLFGKVAGIGAVGVLVLLAGAAPVAVRLALGGSLPPGTAGTLVAALAFSLLGIAMYLCIAGAAGALVERSEDVSSTVGPLTSLLVLGYLIGQFASESPVGVVLAYLPVTSPMVMPGRVALDQAGWIEVLLSLVLLAVATVIAARVATVVYRRAIVRTGRRLKLRDLRA